MSVMVMPPPRLSISRGQSDIPGVKCTTCGDNVSLEDLETHVCSVQRSSSSATAPRSSSRAQTPQTREGRASPSHLVPPHKPLLRRSVTESYDSGPSTSAQQRQGDSSLRPPIDDRRLPNSPTRSISSPSRYNSGLRASHAEVSYNIQADGIFDEPRSIYGDNDQSRLPQMSLHIPDTEIGGQAGRAGVGRRAFAAVAQAALVATSHSFRTEPSTPTSSSYLDPGDRRTPPLSIPRSSPSPSRIHEVRTPSPGLHYDTRIASTSPHKSPGYRHVDPPSPTRLPLPISPVHDEYDDDEEEYSVAYARREDMRANPSQFQAKPLPQRNGSLQSETELSYRDPVPAPVRIIQRRPTASTDGESSATPMQGSPPRIGSSNRVETPRPGSMTSDKLFPFPSQDKHASSMTSASSASSYTNPTIPPDDDRFSVFSADMRRSITTATSSGPLRLSSRQHSKSTGSTPKSKLNQALETLTEEDGVSLKQGPLVKKSTDNTTSNLRSAPAELTSFDQQSSQLAVPGSQSQTKSDKARRPTGSSSRSKRASKTCVRCGKLINDGRWIAVDQHQPGSSASSSTSSSGHDSSGGGVLCEKDWKELYLPKCRRCGLAIEGQAVSSADGQLKGKYHRACFDCSTCHKPFPEKEFYVFAGQPYCDYHYHVINKSICTLESCGEPIEGPCAEDYDGRRYHPEHLVCASRGCTNRLEEYYIDNAGRMLCERHAPRSSVSKAPYSSRERSRQDRDAEPVPPPHSKEPLVPATRKRTT